MAHLLLIASALVGMEVDVISNPYTPALVLSQVYAALGFHPAGSAAEEATRGDDAPVPARDPQWVSHAHLIVSVDETVAIHSHVSTSALAQWLAPGLFAILPPVQAGWEARSTSSLTSQIPGLPQLCRFLC
jgi:hypothetical protein